MTAPARSWPTITGSVKFITEQLLVLVNGKWQYTGTPVPFPATYPMAAVPKGGWPNPPSNVANLLQQFDAAYSSIIDRLQAAWENGSQTDLGKAIGEMFSLSGPAVQLMQIPLSGGRELRARLLVHPFRLTAGLFFYSSDPR